MSLFPAFGAQQKTATPVYTPEASQAPPDADVQIIGKATVPAKNQLPSFSFNSSAVIHKSRNVIKQHSVSNPEVVDVFSSGDEEERRLRRAIRKRKKVEKRQRAKDRSERRRSAALPPPRPATPPKLLKAKFLEQTGLSPETAFCFAEQPDKNNLAFDATYWKDVSKIRRLPKWTLGPFKKSGYAEKRFFRYFNAKELGYMQKVPGSRIPRRTDVVPFGRNYLPFPEDEPPVSIEISSSEGNNESLRLKTARFNERLRASPTDIDLWLDFLRFQDDVANDTFTIQSREEGPTSSRNGLLQRKIAIIERAITSNPSNLGVKIRRLQFCEEVWDKEQLAAEWRKLAFTYPNDPFVWKAYLEFQQAYFPLFQVSKIGKSFQKFISVSRSMLEGTFQSHTPTANHESHLILFGYFLIRFWLESGHQEKGIGLMQGLLEFNLNFPSNLITAMPTKDALVFFEPFWDSGAPRFGASTSRGWDSVMKHKEQVVLNEGPDSALENAENAVIKTASSIGDLWLKLEHFRQKRFLLPFSGGEEPTDPERIVLFDDIGPYLFRFPYEADSSSHPNNSFLLVLCCLNALRCPLPRCFATRGYIWRSMVPDMLENPWLSLFGNWTEGHINDGSTDSFAVTLFQQFQNTWDEGEAFINGIFEQSFGLLQGLQLSFFAACFIQFKLSKYLSAATSCKGLVAREVRSTAKALLKQPRHRNDLTVWEWYAFAEEVLEDNSSASSKVLELVLSSTVPDATDLQTLQLARLVRFYVVSSLGILQASKMDDERLRLVALNTVVQFTEGRKISFEKLEILHRNRILKARKAFEHMVEKCPVLSSDPTGSLHALGSVKCNVVLCWVLFEYLSVGYEGAIKILNDHITRCRESDLPSSNPFDVACEKNLMDWEILTEFFICLNRYHQKNYQLSSESLRNGLYSSLEDFPDNPLLLTIFIKSELKSFVSGRIRSYFDSSVRDAATVIPWIFAIYAEYERKFSMWRNLNAACDKKLSDEISLTTFRDTGISHKIRALFERAVESDVGRHCPLLWRMCLKFECDEDRLARAEGIYYRGIQSCPWAKTVYMDAAKSFPQRIHEIVDVMTEKELRVMVPFEEAELLMNAQDEIKVAIQGDSSATFADE